MSKQSIQVFVQWFCTDVFILFSLQVYDRPKVLLRQYRNDVTSVLLDQELIQILKIAESSTDASVTLGILGRFRLNLIQFVTCDVAFIDQLRRLNKNASVLYKLFVVISFEEGIGSFDFVFFQVHVHQVAVYGVKPYLLELSLKVMGVLFSLEGRNVVGFCIKLYNLMSVSLFCFMVVIDNLRLLLLM